MTIQMRKTVGVLSAVLLFFAAPAYAQMSKGEAANKGGSSHEMMQMMTKGMSEMQSMPMSGDTDRDFAKMMRMHHQQALEMAQMEIKHGKDPKMKEMARKIIEAQRKEIKEFDDWLAKHK